MNVSTQNLAEFAFELEYGDIPTETIERAESFVFDTICCGIGAYTHPAVKSIRSTYNNRKSNDGIEATIIGSKRSVSVEYAALINGTMGRYLDFNDCYDAGIAACHPSDHILPLISVAEATGSNGKDLLEAIVVAYEIQTRCADTGLMWSNGFDYITWGGYAAAAAAGKLFGQTVEEIQNSIGIVAASSNGLLASRTGEVSNWKGIAEPFSIHNGVQASLMTANGITGPKDIFEADNGVFESVTKCPVDISTFPPDGDFQLDRSNFKPYASAYVTQSPISAARELVSENNISVSDIESVLIQTFQRAMHAASPEKWSANLSHETADHSIPYTVAAGIIYGKVTPNQYESSCLQDPSVHDLMDKIAVEESEHLNRRQRNNPGSTPAVVQITAKGTRYSIDISCPRGHPDRPMTDEELLEKGRNLVENYLSEKQFDEVRIVCQRISELNSMDPIIDPLDV